MEGSDSKLSGSKVWADDFGSATASRPDHLPHELKQALLQHDLVDELFLHVYRVAVGKGKRVFPDRIDARFKLASAHPYPTGVVGLSYTKP
jgi:hypothetical protein